MTKVKEFVFSWYSSIRSTITDVYFASATAAYCTETYLLPLAPYVTYTARKVVKHALVKQYPFLAFELSEAASGVIAMNWFRVVTLGYFSVFLCVLSMYFFLVTLYDYLYA